LKTHIVKLIFLFTVISCDFFQREVEGIPIARVNDEYLYQEDIRDLVPEGTSIEDSLIRVNNFINQWATQRLLMSGSRLNLSDEQQEQFNTLVEQYRNDLFIKAYLEGLVKQNIDTVITNEEALEVYETHQESFKLNEELVKLRYVNVGDNNADISEIKERFQRFDNADKKILDSISIQFTSYSLNDSIWVKLDQVVDKISVIDEENRKELLKKSNFIELKDSLGVYLMRINDVRLPNEIAPVEYVMSTIEQIVMNKRKLEFTRQLEKDITKDAIKNKQFEIFK
jgi:hypothetical protein